MRSAKVADINRRQTAIALAINELHGKEVTLCTVLASRLQLVHAVMALSLLKVAKRPLVIEAVDAELEIVLQTLLAEICALMEVDYNLAVKLSASLYEVNRSIMED